MIWQKWLRGLSVAVVAGGLGVNFTIEVSPLAWLK